MGLRLIKKTIAVARKGDLLKENDKIEDIKEELEKMKEQIKDIERKESDHFDCLLRWLLTSDRVTDQLAKVVDARAEMDKISIKLFKSVVEEIKTIKKEREASRETSRGKAKKKI